MSRRSRRACLDQISLFVIRGSLRCPGQTRTSFEAQRSHIKFTCRATSQAILPELAQAADIVLLEFTFELPVAQSLTHNFAGGGIFTCLNDRAQGGQLFRGQRNADFFHVRHGVKPFISSKSYYHIPPMTSLVPDTRLTSPALVACAGERASYRFLEFFTARIRNLHTRRSYGRAVADFLGWLERRGIHDIRQVNSFIVAGWVEEMQREHPAPTVKQRLAAVRMLLDWLATGGVLEFNPATAVRGPKHSVKKGKTPVLAPEEARALIDSIDITTPIGLRDRALIGLMVYSFGRVGAALAMTVEDVFTQNRRLWVRLHEKGGKEHTMPCHHNLEEYLIAYMDGCGLREDPKAPLFRTIGRGTSQLTLTPLPQANTWAMVQRRALAAGIATKIGNHTFRATGITAYLKNGGTLERAATMANHASTRTTQLYDRRSDDITLDEVERVLI